MRTNLQLSLSVPNIKELSFACCQVESKLKIKDVRLDLSYHTLAILVLAQRIIPLFTCSYAHRLLNIQNKYLSIPYFTGSRRFSDCFYHAIN